MNKDDPRVTKLQKMFDESSAVKQIISKERDWDSANNMIRGEQQSSNKPAYKPDAVLNMLRPLIERKISMLTDTKPRFSVLPTRRGEGYAKASKLLDEVANAWWDSESIDMLIARLLMYAQAFGIGITQTRWSVSKQEVVLDVVDPRAFYVDPYVLTTEQLPSAEYVILEETPPLEYVKMRFGALAGEVMQYNPPANEGKAGIVQRITNVLRGPQKNRSNASSVPRALLRHYWIKDYSTRKLEIEKEGNKVEVSERKYPGGRYIIWAHPGVIVHDEPNPYYDQIHPFDAFEWYMDLDSPWGDSEVHTHKIPQLMLNKLAEVITENSMLMNNAIWICDKTAFPATDGPDGWGQLTNAAGAIIKKRPGTEVKREYPSGVSGATMSLLTYLQQFIEHTGGTPDILSGKGKTGNIQSGLGIEAMQMQAAAMVRLKARALEALIQRVGQKYISRVVQFYPQERMLHVLGPGGEFTQYTWIRQNFRDALSSAALEDAHRDFRFHVAPGSSLSLTKTQRALMAVQLYQLGCVDRKEVLEAVEWPDRDEVLKRTMQEQMMGLEPAGAGSGKGKKSRRGPVERQAKIAGRV